MSFADSSSKCNHVPHIIIPFFITTRSKCKAKTIRYLPVHSEQIKGKFPARLLFCILTQFYQENPLFSTNNAY